MSFGIKVLGTYACDSSRGIAWLFEEERALRYPTEKEAIEAATYIARGYDYQIVPLAKNLEEANEEIKNLERLVRESRAILTETTWGGFRYHEYLKKTEKYK
jgi:hypothetical protein